MADGRIHHEPRCTSADDSRTHLFTGRRGDQLRGCDECGRFARADDTAQPPRIAARTPSDARPTPTPTLDADDAHAAAADPVSHRHGCRGAQIRYHTGHAGDLIAKCASCGRTAVAATPDAVDQDDQDDAPAPDAAPATPTRYVCGNHPDRPVSSKGTGCPDCRTDHDARQRARARAARDRRLTATATH